MSTLLDTDRQAATSVGERDRSVDRERWIRWLAPLLIAALAIGAWDLVVRINQIPPYILPGPG